MAASRSAAARSRKAISAPSVRRSSPARRARRFGWATSHAQAMVNQRFVDVHAPHQNLVGRTLEMVQSGPGATYTIVGVVGDDGGGRPGGEPRAVRLLLQHAGLVAGSRVCRPHRRPARARDRSAAHRRRDRFDARHLRPASAGRRRRRGVRSAEARRRDAQLVCERRARPGRHRPLQPVHAGRFGSHARDCRQARARCLAGAR